MAKSFHRPHSRTDTRRPAQAPRPRKPRTHGRYHNSAVPSLGLTRDTELGPLDLVAVEQAFAGKTVWLGRAEQSEVARRLQILAQSDDEAYVEALNNVADARGVQVRAVKRMVLRFLNSKGTPK